MAVEKKIILPLTPVSVEKLGKLTTDVLTEIGTDAENVTSIRIAVENILKKWRSGLGEDTSVTFTTGRRIGKRYITLSVFGKKIDPSGLSDEPDSSAAAEDTTFLETIGVYPSYTYENGVNSITISPPAKRINPILVLFLSVIFGITAGFILRLFPEDTYTAVADLILVPAIQTIITLLTAVALPMMFIAMICAIINLGDSSTFGVVGRRTFLRYLGRLILVVAISIAIAVPFLHFGEMQTMTSLEEISSLYTFFLEIIPENVFTPFIEGNGLQILVIAVIVGIAILALSKKVSDVSRLANQINQIIFLIMEWILLILPVCVFLIMITLVLMGPSISSGSILLVYLLMLVPAAINICIVLFETVITKKVSPVRLLKKMLSPIAIATVTGATISAYPKNILVCTKKLGIDRRLADFGVPMGLMIMSSGCALNFIWMSLGMAYIYDVTISLHWLAIAGLLAVLLAIATPSVTGAEIVSYTLVFSLLDIPTTAVVLAATVNLLLYFISEPLTIITTDLDLVQIAGKSGMLDEDVLRSDG